MSSPPSSPAESAAKPRKEKPSNVVIPPPKPKLSKAERRAMQEQQRADKEARGGAKRPSAAPVLEKPKAVEASTAAATTTTTTATASTSAAAMTSPQQYAPTKKRDASVSLVSHLPAYHDPSRVFSLMGPTLQLSPSVLLGTVASGTSDAPMTSPSPAATITTTTTLHPAVLQLGLDYATLRIRGGNARCRAMLHCFRTLLLDYKVPPPALATSKSPQWTDIRQAVLHHLLNPAFAFWTHSCRPHSVSMGNAFTFLKHVVASLDRTETTVTGSGNTTSSSSSTQSQWHHQRQLLLDTLEQYERERLDFAKVAIADLAMPLLSKTNDEEEVILTFGYSEVVATVLMELAKKGTSTRVIVVDSRPDFSGKKLLRLLCQAGMPCTYILVNALSYVLQDVTKVLLGASALFSDGSVLGRIGTGCVGLAAHMQRVPVLVCCETYKISNKLYLESITHNELGNPNALDIPTTSPDGSDATNTDGEAAGSDAIDSENPVKKLHLMYDLTPAAFVSGIVTELGIVPATSVAVLLREMSPQEFKYDD